MCLLFIKKRKELLFIKKENKIKEITQLFVKLKKKGKLKTRKTRTKKFKILEMGLPCTSLSCSEIERE